MIGGSGRLVAIRELRWTDCDVVELDLDYLQATALAIALHRTGELAEWDLPTFSRLLDELKSDEALDGLGFDVGQLDEIRDSLLSSLNSDVVQD